MAVLPFLLLFESDLGLIAFFSILLLLCGTLAVLTRTWVKKKV